MLGIVYSMTCVCDAVMLYGGGLHGLMVRCCMVMCNKALRAVLLFIIGRDGLSWLRGGADWKLCDETGPVRPF